MREMKMRDMIMGETIMLERIDNAKRSFHRAANGIFGKVGRLASEEVVVQLLLHKCMPILLHALEVCALVTRDLYSHWTSLLTVSS